MIFATKWDVNATHTLTLNNKIHNFDETFTATYTTPKTHPYSHVRPVYHSSHKQFAVFGALNIEFIFHWYAP